MNLRSLLAAAGVALLGCCTALAKEPQGLRLDADPSDQAPAGAVIVLNNCDDSDRDKRPDHADEQINGKQDLAQLTPLWIRSPKGPIRGPVTLRLENAVPNSLAPESVVRVFRASRTRAGSPADAASRTSILGGPEGGAECRLDSQDAARLAEEDLPLYLEGLQFGGFVDLAIFEGTAKTSELTIQVAPFLLLPHTQPPLYSMVVHVDGWQESTDYVKDFDHVCRKAAEGSPRLAGRCLARQLDVDSEHGDVWIEDELQWGYTETPRSGCMPVALQMYRLRELQEQVRALLEPSVGYFEACDYRKPLSGDSLDYGGNLEVTPPTEKWPFGRVYYGSVPSRDTENDKYDSRQIAPQFQAFFKRQKRYPSDANAIQEPINLNTDWLVVGHVDEYVCFVPADNKQGFVLLWASPSYALDLLRDLPPAERRDPRYLDPDYRDPNAGQHESRYLTYYNCRTAQDLLDLNWAEDTKAGLRCINLAQADFYGQRSLADYNAIVDERIRREVRVLADKETGLDLLAGKEGLDLLDDKVKEVIKPVPVLFCNYVGHDKNGRITPHRYWQAVALTPGMVNLTSLDRTVIAPDPLARVFWDDFSATLKSVGQSAMAIDDWSLYHIRDGEVHCGSNTQRQPFAHCWWNPQAKRR